MKALLGGWLSFRHPLSRFATKPCPLDGCPMFADFRVHGLNKMGDPDFLYAAPDKTACAAFSKESRMRFANAIKLHRKSGGSPFLFLFL
jgi:hypothetical protein